MKSLRLPEMKKTTDKNISLRNPFMIGVMSLITILLSTVALEVGTRLTTTGKTSLRLKFNFSDVIAGIMASTLLTIGNIKNNPYFFLPWLVLTVKGFISYQGPALLGLGYLILPTDGFPAAVFFFSCAFLFVEEICLWSEVFNIWRWSWKIYKKRLICEKKKQVMEMREDNIARMYNAVFAQAYAKNRNNL